MGGPPPAQPRGAVEGPPPWRKALEDWPKRPLGANVYLYVSEEEAKAGRPRTLGEWLQRGGA